jgi:hypothetical protein
MPKEKIHPQYDAVKVLCACGSSFETRSTHKGATRITPASSVWSIPLAASSASAASTPKATALWPLRQQPSNRAPAKGSHHEGLRQGGGLIVLLCADTFARQAYGFNWKQPDLPLQVRPE